MSIGRVIGQSFDRSFRLYQDLIDAIDETVLSSKLGLLPSNTAGLQLWCVVGARESFVKAIAANQWSGFTCSLETTTDKESVADALRRTAYSVSEALKTIDMQIPQRITSARTRSRSQQLLHFLAKRSMLSMLPKWRPLNRCLETWTKRSWRWLEKRSSNQGAGVRGHWVSLLMYFFLTPLTRLSSETPNDRCPSSRAREAAAVIQ